MSPFLFRMFVHPDGSLLQHICSFGDGVERETVHLAFKQYQKNTQQWFIPRSGKYSTIAMSQPFLLQQPTFSSTRLEAISVLGVLMGFMLIYGMAPMPLSPALLQFLLHGCDFHLLTPGFIQEWLPDLYDILTDWKCLDASGDVESFDSHFKSSMIFLFIFTIFFYHQPPINSKISRRHVCRIACKTFMKPLR